MAALPDADIGGLNGRSTTVRPSRSLCGAANRYVIAVLARVNASVRPRGSNTRSRSASWMTRPVRTSRILPATPKPALL